MAVLFSRKKNVERRTPGNAGSQNSAPVVRYYRPTEQAKNKQIRDLPRSQQHLEKSVSKGKGILKVLRRSIGVIAILVVFIANFGLSDVGIQVKITDSWPVNAENYKNGIRDILHESIWNQTKITLRSTTFENKIKEKFPEVKQATVVVPLVGRRLQVNIVLSEPLLRVMTVSNKQGILGADGKVILLDSSEVINSSFHDLPSLSIPNLPVNVGDQIITSDELSLISLLLAECDASSPDRPKVSSIEFDPKKRELNVKFQSVNYYAKLTPERESRAQVGALVATIKDMRTKNTLVNEYIDVRAEGRVFIK